MTDRRTFLVQAAGALSAVALVPESIFAAPIQRADVSIGIIGVGRHGRALMAELQRIPGVRIAALCDVEDSRLQAGLRRAEGAEGFADHRAMLDKRADLQAVIIATPTHLHKDPAIDALAAGKHVYCETPLAHTVDDCRAVASAAKSANSIFAAALEGRANPVYQLARTFFRSDSVRDLVSMRAQHSRKTNLRVPVSNPASERALNWRLDPGVSLGLAGEWGVQQLDVFMWYTDRLPVSVRGWGVNKAFTDEGRKVADTIGLDFAFERDAHLDFQATACNSYEGRYEVLYGTNAAIKLAWSHGWMFKEADAPTQGWEVYANRQQFHNDEGITLIAGATKLAEQGKLKEGIGLPYSPQYYALADFLKAVTEGSTPAASASDAARASVACIAANQAVKTGENVTIDSALLRSL